MSKASYDLYDNLNNFIQSFSVDGSPIASDMKQKVVSVLINELSQDSKYDPFDPSIEKDMILRDIVSRYISRKEFESICSFENNLELNTKNDFDAFSDVVGSYIQSDIAYEEGDERTPYSLNDLFLTLIKFNPTDDVADLCAGQGGMFENLAGPDSNFEADTYEMNRMYWESDYLTDRSCERPYCMNVFDLAADKTKRYSKIVANYPFNVKYGPDSYEFKVAQKIAQDFGMPELINGTSSDWLFNLLIMKVLKKGGRAVAVMTHGSATNKLDSKIRKAFIEKGFIDAVITLPERIFTTTNIKTSIIVFSFGNTGVKLVDASNMCTPERRIKVLDDDTYDQVFEALNKDGENGTTVTPEQLESNDYILYQGRYLGIGENLESVTVGSVCNRITRGVGIKADELDELYSLGPTDNRFLMMTDICNGEFKVSELRSLKRIEERYRKYCVEDKNIILAKNTYPFKVAVAEVDDSITVLANSNLFILELDKEKMNPYFLKMYLESEEGQSRLRNMSTGTSAANIGVSDLKRLTIPCPSMKTQELIVHRYLKKLKEIHDLETLVYEGRTELSQIISEYILANK